MANLLAKITFSRIQCQEITKCHEIKGDLTISITLNVEQLSIKVIKVISFSHYFAINFLLQFSLELKSFFLRGNIEKMPSIQSENLDGSYFVSIFSTLYIDHTSASLRIY